MTWPTQLYTPARGSDAPRNDIELLAFLTRPGTLEIEIGGHVQQKQAGAGMTSFRVPLQNGRPVFRLLRAGKAEISLPGAFSISDKIVYSDLLYRSGGSNRAPVGTTP